MHVRVIKETVERLRRDQVFRHRVVTNPDLALAGLRLTRDERLALAALSRQPDAATVLQPVAW